ncbi:MAG: NADH-quinone oxidoreductase subunit C [Alphaproteobacteria bacterium]|nr:NADH-quinone oxidoreductase subunit C [Alphaproteobacteria bacterium]
MPPKQPLNFETFLRDHLGPDLIDLTHNLETFVVHVYSGSIIRTLTILKDNKRCSFKQLIDITAVDYPKRLHRFDVVYNLLSHKLNIRVRIKINTTEETPVNSITEIFPAANWFEREIFDLFGIHFTDHPNLQRILTDYNFTGHPLRKDFPLSGFTQVRYDETNRRVTSEPVKLEQEYRDFNFISPWEGPQNRKIPAPTPNNQKAVNFIP